MFYLEILSSLFYFEGIFEISQFLRVFCINGIWNRIGIRICIFDYQSIFREIGQ